MSPERDTPPERQPRPYVVPDDVLADLRARLARAQALDAGRTNPHHSHLVIGVPAEEIAWVIEHYGKRTA